MLRLVVIFGALLAVVWGQTTQVSQCTANPGELPLNAYIAGCDVPPCQLRQLEYAVINIIFRAPRTMHNMRTLAVAYLTLIGFPVPVPYDLGENAHTCNFLDNSYCPVLEDEIIMYTLHMFIEQTFPVGISPTIEFRIEDENEIPVICIRIPVTIVAGGATRNSTVNLIDTGAH